MLISINLKVNTKFAITVSPFIRMEIWLRPQKKTWPITRIKTWQGANNNDFNDGKDPFKICQRSRQPRLFQTDKSKIWRFYFKHETQPILRKPQKHRVKLIPSIARAELANTFSGRRRLALTFEGQGRELIWRLDCLPCRLNLTAAAGVKTTIKFVCVHEMSLIE